MENTNFIENLAARLGQSATLKNVYGEPVVAGDKTIIPVAQVIYGFGGGYGYGRKPKKSLNQEDNSAADSDEKKKRGEGLGGGGGIIAKPRGVYEISKKGTRFIPANNKNLLIAITLTLFVLRGLIRRKK